MPKGSLGNNQYILINMLKAQNPFWFFSHTQTSIVKFNLTLILVIKLVVVVVVVVVVGTLSRDDDAANVNGA